MPAFVSKCLLTTSLLAVAATTVYGDEWESVAPPPAVFAVTPKITLPQNNRLDTYQGQMRIRIASQASSSHSVVRQQTGQPRPSVRSEPRNSQTSSRVIPASHQEMSSGHVHAQGSMYDVSESRSTSYYSDATDSASKNFSYYFRPYNWNDIEKQRSSSFIADRSNAYDNRFFEDFYRP